MLRQFCSSCTTNTLASRDESDISDGSQGAVIVCGTQRPSPLHLERSLASLRSHYTRGAANRALLEQEPAIVGVPVTYHVLWSAVDSSTRVPLATLQAQHRQLSLDFTKRNADINKVPSSGRYKFASECSSVGVVFLPILSSFAAIAATTAASAPDINVRRTELPPPLASGTFAGVNEILASNLSPPVAGHLNVYIAPLTEGLLGQATVGGTTLVVAPRTVGSLDVPSFAGDKFSFGRTLTHEVAHCFGGVHPFDLGCFPSPLAAAAAPPTRLPNFGARLREVSPGVWDGTGCNRDLDVRGIDIGGGTAAHPYACGESYEQFMSFLDYAPDKHSVMFNAWQARTMHVYVRFVSDLDWVDVILHNDDKEEVATAEEDVSQLPGVITLPPIIISGPTTTGTEEHPSLEAPTTPPLPPPEFIPEPEPTIASGTPEEEVTPSVVTNSPKSSKRRRISPGGVAGIVVSIVLAVALLVALLVLLSRRLSGASY